MYRCTIIPEETGSRTSEIKVLLKKIYNSIDGEERDSTAYLELNSTQDEIEYFKLMRKCSFNVV